jgi:hypothetical protein
VSSEFGTVISDAMFVVNTGQVSPPSVQTVKVRNSSSAAAANKQVNPAGAVTGGAAEAEVSAEAASNSSKRNAANKNINDSNGNNKKPSKLQSSNADR